jgi:hypothetical protein
MWGGTFEAWLTRTATAGLVILGGCGAQGAERGRPSVPPVAAIPVAPTVPPEPAVAIEPAAPLPPLPSVAANESPPLPASNPEMPPADGAAPSGATEPAPPAAGALVSLLDELPFRHSPSELAEPTTSPHRHSKRRGHHHRPYHPAPGIIVDVIDAVGGASAADLQRAARNIGYWPFRHCYEEGLRRNQRLGGKVSLEVRVTPTGVVERVTEAAATVGDASVVTCVAREALHLALVPGESPTDAKMAVTLATGDEPVPVPAPVRGADELREALRAHWPAVEQCYAAELPKHPDAGGRMELSFRLGQSGMVAEVAEGDTRFSDGDVTRCVLGVYRTTTLPAPHRAPRDESFVYAMHFEPRSNVLPVQ